MEINTKLKEKQKLFLKNNKQKVSSDKASFLSRRCRKIKLLEVKKRNALKLQSKLQSHSKLKLAFLARFDQHIGHLISYAIKNNDFEGMKSLLKINTDLEKQNVEGRTCLGAALFLKKNSMVRFLVSRGANVNYKDQKGNSYLHQLCTDELFDIPSLIDTLLELGISINAQNNSGRTALDCFIKHFIQTDAVPTSISVVVLSKLIEYGASPALDEENNLLCNFILAYIIIRGMSTLAENDVTSGASVLKSIMAANDYSRIKRNIMPEARLLIGLGFSKDIVEMKHYPDGTILFSLEYSPELKNFLGYHVEESQIPAALRTVALYSHYDQHEVYRQQRESYIKSLPTSEDPDAYYKLALLCIDFPQRLVMDALEKIPYKENTVFENLTLLYKGGRAYYWNATAEITDPSRKQKPPLISLIKRLPVELIEYIIRTANSLESVEKTLAQLPRIKSKVLESTDSRNEFRKTMYADNYKGMANW